MNNDETLQAQSSQLIKLIEELKNFAVQMKDRQTAMEQTAMDLNTRSSAILELCLEIKTVRISYSHQQERQVADLLRELRETLSSLDTPSAAHLEDLMNTLHVPEGTLEELLAAEAPTRKAGGGEEAVWNRVFVIGLATIASAGVGAPLAAFFTQAPIGKTMLAEAITTFAGVATVEAGVALKEQKQNKSKFGDAMSRKQAPRHEPPSKARLDDPLTKKGPIAQTKKGINI